MLDFHSHILPNIDDGSRSIEETINLIKEARDAGFEGISLTSHYFEGYYETGKAEREVLLQILKEQLKNKGIDINLYLSNEIYLTDNMMQLLIDGKASTINDSSYVLFELPLNATTEPMNMYNVVYSLQQNKLIPVLAHPERYACVQKDPNLVYDWIEQGLLMQSNYCSILGRYGKKAQFIVKKLLENDMVHFLGSDVHQQDTLYKKIPIAIKEIKNIIGEEKFNKISTINPELAVSNRRIDIDSPKEIEITFKEKIELAFTNK